MAKPQQVKSMGRNKRGDPVTVERLEAALDNLSIVMAIGTKHPEGYLPIYQRLEYELAASRERQATLTAIRARGRRVLGTVEGKLPALDNNMCGAWIPKPQKQWR